MIFKKAKVFGSDIQFAKFPGIQRPKFADTLKFPDDITELASRNISELHGKYTALLCYANQEAARINMQILRVETSISARKNQVFRENPSMNQQERWRRDAVMDTDEKIEDLEEQLCLLKCEKEQTQMYLSNFDRYIAALSRELSRKMSESNLKHLG